MPLAIVQEIRTVNTPNGHGRTLYRVSVYEGAPHSGGPIPCGVNAGAHYAATRTTLHVDNYGERGYTFATPSAWHVVEYPVLHITPGRWNALAKQAKSGTHVLTGRGE